MTELLKKFTKLFSKTETLKSDNGNEFFYTKTGFGVKISNTNKAKQLYTFAVKDQIKRNPNLATEHPELALKIKL